MHFLSWKFSDVEFRYRGKARVTHSIYKKLNKSTSQPPCEMVHGRVKPGASFAAQRGFLSLGAGEGQDMESTWEGPAQAQALTPHLCVVSSRVPSSPVGSGLQRSVTLTCSRWGRASATPTSQHPLSLARYPYKKGFPRGKKCTLSETRNITIVIIMRKAK